MSQESFRCPSCKNIVPMGTVYCPQCGAITQYGHAILGSQSSSFTNASQPTPSQQVSASQSMQYGGNNPNIPEYNVPAPPPPPPQQTPLPPTLPVTQYTPHTPLPPTPQRFSLHSKLVRLVVIGLAVLLVLFGIFIPVAIVNHNNQVAAQQQLAATATTRANATAIAQARATGAAQSIAATATAQANPYGGTLSISDPLRDSSRGYWDVGRNNTGGDCEFSGNAYHVSQSSTSYLQICYESNDFSNFAFEVQMTIVKGDCGGIEFRSNRTTGKSYDFEVCQNGSYKLVLYVNSNGTNVNTLISSSSSAIHTGLNASNVIAVVANGSMLDLYVNMQKIASVTDSTYNHGIIGLIADPTNNPTELVYINAKGWKF
jgi:hypothetical protein